MPDPDSQNSELQERMRLAERMWWNMPIMACMFFLPQVFFLWGYFGTAGWVDRIPALSHLGAPVFIAIALGLVTRAVLRIALMISTYISVRGVTSRTRVLQFIASSSYATLLIILQNIALVKFSPTIFSTFQAARCALSLILKKPSWSFASEVSKKWDLADRNRHARYMLSMFAGYAILNAIVAFYFSTDVWVIYNVVAFYCFIGVSAFSTYIFREAIFAS